MKKILSIFILGIFLIGLVAPMLAQAQEDLPSGCKLTNSSATWAGAKCVTPGPAAFCDTTGPEATAGDCGMCCLIQVVYNVTNWIFYLMMIAVVIVFVAAGAIYMMSSGDAEKTKRAKGLMIYGIVGLVVALIAKLIPSVVKLIVGM